MRPVSVLPERERGVCCVPAAMPAESEIAPAVLLLRAVADGVRLRMLAALRASDAPICICDFTAALNLSQATVSHHMGKLREAGLVEAQKRGLWVHYTLHTDMAPAARRVLDAVLG